MSDRWNLGEPRQLGMEFRDAGGTLTDPTTITVTVAQPSGVVLDLSATVAKQAVGRYTVTFASTQVGEHVFRVVTTGPVATVTEQVLYSVPPYEVIESSANAMADAAREIGRMTAATESPVLTDEDIQQLVDYGRTRAGTVNLRRAAAEGWRWKAARVAGAFSFSADGVAVDKTMVVKHCLLMADHYEAQDRKATGVRSVGLRPRNPA